MKKFVWFMVGVLSTISITAFAERAGFTDQDMFADWYSGSVNELASIGVLEGYPDGSFQPANNVNRAELAVMFNRFKDYVDAKVDGQDVGDGEIAEEKVIYYAQGFDEEYTAVNTETGENVEYIPEGYKIVSQWNYPTFTEYLILRKDNKIYRYTLEDGSLDEIGVGELKELEEVWLYTSISNDDKMFMVLADTVETDGMYGYEVVGIRQYFYDIASNTLEEANDIDINGVDYYSYSGCSVYDSKYSRFLTWPCGEGIGSSIPLTAYYFEDDRVEEVVGFEDFGISEDIGRIGVDHNNGYFIMTTKVSGEFDSIMVADANSEEIVTTTYTFDEDVLTQIDRYSPYSAMIAEDYNTIVIGGGSFILMMKYNENNVINDFKYFEEPGIYANFIFTDGDNLYYRNSNIIKIIDFDSWEITDNFASQDLESVTLLQM